MGWLAVIGVINSVISLFYYMKVIRPMFFDPAPADAQPITYSRWIQAGLVIAAVMTLLIMLFPMPFYNLASGGAYIFGVAMR